MSCEEGRVGKASVEITLRNKLQAGLNRAAAGLWAFVRIDAPVEVCFPGDLGSPHEPIFCTPCTSRRWQK